MGVVAVDASQLTVAIRCAAGRVLISVEDASRFRLVEAMATRWGAERNAAGKVVWAELRP